MAETIKYSESYIPTLKETPADAETISHKLLLRAGLVRKLASGLYTYLPLGLRVINKISSIVREEMNRAGFHELLLPMVQPADLWKETGRWDYYGKELLRFQDRNERDYCLGPTHEEVITDLVRSEVKSYKQLPVRLYQIQTKFRDEMRPRFGLMRGREFIMKDAYSFDNSLESAKKSYQLMYEAYYRIFNRLGLKFRAVEADTGSIGGNFSHEFMILAESGEDTIVVCDNCDFASNVERAEVKVKDSQADKSGCEKIAEVETPDAHTVEQVCAFLNVKPQKLIKTLIYHADKKPVAVLIRGDREVNEIKLKHLLNAEDIELAPSQIVREITNAPVGFAGPVNISIPVYADNEILKDTDYITGANKNNTHLLHVDPSRDIEVTQWADLRNITSEDNCPKCGGNVFLAKGIEAGHVFMLGQKYSKPMNAVFLDENGKEQTMIMGCYGIGVSRLAAAAIEQGHDEKGIIFPKEIAPVECLVINLDPKDDKVTKAANEICKKLNAHHFDVLLDDRKERPGVKFNDADLLGIPYQIIIGAKGLSKGVIECKKRASGEKKEIGENDFIEKFMNWIKDN